MFFRSKDGSYITIFTRATLVLDSQGKPVRMVGTHLDVTERANLEAKLRHSHKLEAIGQLAAGVAHEFNNMLTVILGYTEDPQAQHPERLEFGAIHTAAERSRVLTHHLLAFSRRQILRVRPAGINVLVRQLADTFGKMLRSEEHTSELQSH